MSDFELRSSPWQRGLSSAARLNVGPSLEVREGERLSTVRCCERLKEDGRLGGGGERERVLRRETWSRWSDGRLLGWSVEELRSVCAFVTEKLASTRMKGSRRRLTIPPMSTT